MYGSVVSRRSRARLVVCAIALVVLSAMALTPSVAAAKEAPTTSVYLALGDSVAFGQTEEGFKNNSTDESPSFFEEGYANDLAKDLRRSREVGKGLTLVNDSCPSDTSSTIIGENEAIGGHISTEESSPPARWQGLGDYHPCAYHELEGFPLHNSLGEESQLEEALGTLNEGHPAHEVKLITLEVGANDELAGLTQCEDEIIQEENEKGSTQYGETPFYAFNGCIIVKSEGGRGQPSVFKHITASLNTILSELTGDGPGEGHYTGPIVLGGFYNPDAFSIRGSNPLQNALNELVEEEVLPNFPNVTFANPFPVFNPEKKSEAQKKEAICKYTEMCNPNVQKTGSEERPYQPAGEDGDINPSPAGAKVIAKGMNIAYMRNPAR